MIFLPRVDLMFLSIKLTNADKASRGEFHISQRVKGFRRWRKKSKNSLVFLLTSFEEQFHVLTRKIPLYTLVCSFLHERHNSQLGTWNQSLVLHQKTHHHCVGLFLIVDTKERNLHTSQQLQQQQIIALGSTWLCNIVSSIKNIESK